MLPDAGEEETEAKPKEKFERVYRTYAWQLYNRDLYHYNDDIINVICELLAVKHGDLELYMFSYSVSDAFIAFYELVKATPTIVEEAFIFYL